MGHDDGKTKGEYAAILYDTRRFAVDTSGTFWLSDTQVIRLHLVEGNSITRICTQARLIDRNTGQSLYVYNAHYDHQLAGITRERRRLGTHPRSHRQPCPRRSGRPDGRFQRGRSQPRDHLTQQV
ncbi:MAG: hypothetical protein R3B67_13680 [Phycisphaerales bacterium]